MESRVGVLRCHYRVVGDRGRVAVATLQKLAKETLLERYVEALDLALGDDPCVYILRSVPVRLTLTNVTARAEGSMARQWGERLCGAVVRTIVADDQSSGNVVRFSGQGEYVAYFIRDLLGDRAWDQWFYGAFRSLRTLSKHEALKVVLRQNRTCVASIFRHLGRLDALTSALALLSSDGMKWLWHEVILPSKARVDRSSIRPLFFAAIQLARRLGIWIGPEQPESVVLPQLALSSFISPDWTDRRHLAAAVLSILRFLQTHGFMTPLDTLPTAGISASVETICRQIDWLDSEWLAREVRQSFVPQSRGGIRRAGPLVQSHRVLLEKLVVLIRAGSQPLDRSRPDSEHNAAMLFAALSVHHPELEKTAGAAEIIQRLLACWQFMVRVGEPDALLRAFEEDRLETVLGDLSADEQSSALRAFQAIESLQPLASEVLRTLVDFSSSPPLLKSASETHWSSKCAGLFLLLRALQDLRVPQLAIQAEIPRLSDLLLGLGIAWAGVESRDLEMFDPSVLLWADLSPDAQPEISSIESPEFLKRTLELLHDRRAVESSPIRIFETKLRGTVALVVSDVSGKMFPLAAWLNDSQDPQEVESDLVTQWQLATKSEPLVERDQSARTVFDAASEELISAWPVDIPLSLTVLLAAIVGLRLWARWLPGIASASVPYFLKNLIRRPGTIQVSDEEIVIRLKPGAIDIVLEMAGYLRKMECVPWLNGRNVLFHIDRGSR